MTSYPMTEPGVSVTWMPKSPPAGWSSPPSPIVLPATMLPAPAASSSMPENAKSQIRLPAPPENEPPMMLPPRPGFDDDAVVQIPERQPLDGVAARLDPDAGADELRSG